MKKIKFLLFPLLIIALFSLNSCGENEPVDGFTAESSSEAPAEAAANGLFKVDFKGSTWIAAKIEASIFNNTITILAEKANGESFVIGVVEGAIAGVYPANINEIGYFPAGSIDGYYSLNNDNLSENTGSISVSSINTSKKTISGTFNFKGYWGDNTKTPIVFTNGIFKDIPYTNTDPSAGGGTDTFSAKVDGTEFVENAIDFAEVDASGVPAYYSIVGKKTNGESIGLRITKTLSTGTYQITGSLLNNDVVGGHYLINNTLYNAESGSITITSKTAVNITGTFNFIGKNFTSGNTKAITAGTFSIEL